MSWNSVAVEASALLALTLGIIAWDIFLAADKRKRNTISAMIAGASETWWIIPYAWGVLGGHWFVSKSLDVPVWLTGSSLVVAGVVVLVLNLKRVRLPAWVAAAIGFVHGGLLWSQG